MEKFLVRIIFPFFLYWTVHTNNVNGMMAALEKRASDPTFCQIESKPIRMGIASHPGIQLQVRPTKWYGRTNCRSTRCLCCGLSGANLAVCTCIRCRGYDICCERWHHTRSTNKVMNISCFILYWIVYHIPACWIEFMFALSWKTSIDTLFRPSYWAWLMCATVHHLSIELLVFTLILHIIYCSTALHY